jgi:hypothetical protein
MGSKGMLLSIHCQALRHREEAADVAICICRLRVLICLNHMVPPASLSEKDTFANYFYKPTNKNE